MKKLIQQEHTREYRTKKGIKKVVVNKGKKEDKKFPTKTAIGAGLLGTLGLAYLLRNRKLITNTPKSVSSPKVKKPRTINTSNPKTRNYTVESNYTPEPKLIDTPTRTMELGNPVKYSKNKWRKQKTKSTPRQNKVESVVSKVRSKPKDTKTIILGTQVNTAPDTAYLPQRLIEDLRHPLQDSEKATFVELMSKKYTDYARHYLAPKPEKVDLIKAQGKGKIDKLGLDEADVLSLASYTGDGYIGMNSLLRGQLDKAKPKVKEMSALAARQLNTALDKIPNYDGTVFRGTRLTQQVLDEFKEGSDITLKGFTSASKMKNAAKQYSITHTIPEGSESLKGTKLEALVRNQTKQGKFPAKARYSGVDLPIGKESEVEFIIQSSTGKDVGQLLSATQQDVEVLFKSNSKFKVISKTRIDNKWEIELEELKYEESFKSNVSTIISFQNNKSRIYYIDQNLRNRLTDQLVIQVDKY